MPETEGRSLSIRDCAVSEGLDFPMESASQVDPSVDGSDAGLSAIRCFLVDDEQLARKVLKHLLSRHSDFTVVGEAGELSRAWDGIQQTGPDVVFLDIQLDQDNGFDLVRQFQGPAPVIVFVTAYDEFAVRAFDVRAVDYLLKPVDEDRFDEAANRVRSRLGRSVYGIQHSASARGASLPEAPIFVQAGRGGCFIAAKEILCIQSDRNYSSVSMADGQAIIVRQTLGGWVQRLPKDSFLQIDRTTIVNLLQIRRTEFGSHSGLIHLNHLREPLEIGRQAALRLREVLLKKP
jgi:two-component system LytT family response regulator